MIEAKAPARRIYFSARRSGASHLRALLVIRPMLEHQQRREQNDLQHGVAVQGAVLPTTQEIEVLAADDAWDLQFEQLQRDDFRDNLRAPEDEEDRFRLRLDAAQQQRERASDILRAVQAEADNPTFSVTDGYLTRLANASRIFDAACRSETRLEDEARRRLLEMPSGPAAVAEIDARQRKLMEEYGDLGPQYELLCKQLAGLDYQRDMQMRSGRDVPTDEIVRLNDAIIRTIGQLQKYTESTKSESLSKDRNQLALALLDIGEKIFGTSAPQQWAAYIVAIKQRLQSIDRDERRSILNTGTTPRSVLSLVPTSDGSYGRED